MSTISSETRRVRLCTAPPREFCLADQRCCRHSPADSASSPTCRRLGHGGVQHSLVVEGAVRADGELAGGAGVPCRTQLTVSVRKSSRRGRRPRCRRAAGTSAPARSARTSPAAGGSRDTLWSARSRPLLPRAGTPPPAAQGPGTRSPRCSLVVPVTLAAVSGVDGEHSGLVAGASTIAIQVGGSIGAGRPGNGRHHQHPARRPGASLPDALTHGYTDAFRLTALVIAAAVVTSGRRSWSGIRGRRGAATGRCGRGSRWRTASLVNRPKTVSAAALS